MMARRVALGFILLSLIQCEFVKAGVYNTAEPDLGPRLGKDGAMAMPFRQFRNLLTDLVNASVPQPESPLRTHYVEKEKGFRARNSSGALTIQDQINWSAYLIRLARYDEAVDVLSPLAAQERHNFMLLSNLSTAHYLAGRLSRAIEYLTQAVESMPSEWSGLSKEQLDWYSRTEKYYMKLFRSRAREEIAGRSLGQSQSATNLDDLFGVVFVSDRGKYEAGHLAEGQRKKIPRDAVAIVQQLLIWLPGDSRLYWQLGELLNAQGDVADAATVLDDCVWSRRFDAPEIRLHRQILQAVKASESLPFEAGDNLPSPAESGIQPAESRSWLPDKPKMLTVAGVAGFIIVFLAYLQFREIRRHRSKGSLSK